jgi:hypothetical protein
MSIPVVCPGCHKAFRVSDKFAGKSGPCPNCKATIQVPAKVAEVQVHAPEAFASGGRTAAGKLATQPIARLQTKLQPVTAAIIAGVAVLITLAAWAGGGRLKDYLLARSLGLLLISPLVVFAAYTFLRDDELEPYRGAALYIRCGLCALGYAVLWGVFSYLTAIEMLRPGDLFSWALAIPAFLTVGGLAALASLDLDFGSAFFHYAFYLLVTILLQGIAGMGWIWDAPTPPTM